MLIEPMVNSQTCDDQTISLCEAANCPSTISEGVWEIKNRWLTLCSDHLSEVALLEAGWPYEWAAPALQVLREFCLEDIEGTDFNSFVASAEVQFMDLLLATSREMAGAELAGE